ncbi:hypothetical protein NHX12_009513, partial [Muraenolepis orangiensis]
MDLRITFSPGHVSLVKEEQSAPSGRVVLVTGATGLLGRVVLAEFQREGWRAVGTAYRRARGPILRCDLLDEDAVRSLLHQLKPDVVVHCAAERRPDVVERHSEAAVNLNVLATSSLAKEAAAAGMVFLYISTDYVFDGRHPPYGEDDAPNPLNLYGRSKLEGERETLRQCPGAVVLRVPVLYGEVEHVAESAVTALWPRVLQGAPESCTLDHCQQRFPTYTGDVAALSEAAPGVSRPQNPQLDCSRLRVLGLSVEPRPFSSNITSCLWPFLPDKRWRQTEYSNQGYPPYHDNPAPYQGSPAPYQGSPAPYQGSPAPYQAGWEASKGAQYQHPSSNP